MKLATKLLAVCIGILGNNSYALAASNASEASDDSSSYSTSITYNEDFFKSITYEWTDENGVKQTSTLADEANHGWRQIKPFIKAVMENRTIPGTIKDPTQEQYRPTNGRIINKTVKDKDEVLTVSYTGKNGYFMNNGSDNNFMREWGINLANEDLTPDEDGMTAILVKLKHNYTKDNGKYGTDASFTSEMLINDNVESMQIMTNRLRIEGDNPGWIFNVRASFNKFFIMTKGKLRQTFDKPFAGMFEQFSPSEDDVLYDNAYEKMLRNEAFEIRHDCKGAITKYHPALMGDVDNIKEYMASLLIFIPDNRFASVQDSQRLPNYEKVYNDQSKKWLAVGEDWTRDANTSFIYYNPEFRPTNLFNTATLEVGVIEQFSNQPVPAIDDDDETTSSSSKVLGNVVVTLKWQTNISSMIKGTDQREKFHIYRVVDGVKHAITDPNDIILNDWDIYTTVVVEDGEVVIYHSPKDSQEVQIGVLEDQYHTGYQVDYIIDAAIENVDISYVESNSVTALIPGLSALERCELTVIGTPSSEFVYQEDENDTPDHNHYVHKFGLENHSEYKYPLLAGHLIAKGGEYSRYFALTRALSQEDIVNDEAEELQRLTITSYTDEEDGYTYFKGVFSNNPDEEVTLFRSLTDDGETAPVEPVNNDAKVWFTTEFDAITTNNDHPEKYFYRLESNIPIVDEDTEEDGYAKSMIISISIPHSSISTTFPTYTANQIMNDNGTLPASNRSVTYNVKNNTDISTYSVMLNGEQKIAEARRAQDGSYSQIFYYLNSNDEDNTGDSTESAKSIEAGEQAFELEHNVESMVGHAVTVMTDFNGNTYGSGRTTIPSEIIIDGSIETLSKVTGSYNTYFMYAKWNTQYPDSFDKYYRQSNLVNTWLALYDSASEASSETFGENASETIALTSSKSREAVSEVSECAYFCEPEWTVGVDSPLTTNLLVRYYPQVVTEEETVEPMYAVVESVLTKSADGLSVIAATELPYDDNFTTPVDVNIYSIQGICMRSYTAQGSVAEIINAGNLPSGIYIARIGDRVLKVKI